MVLCPQAQPLRAAAAVARRPRRAPPQPGCRKALRPPPRSHSAAPRCLGATGAGPRLPERGRLYACRRHKRAGCMTGTGCRPLCHAPSTPRQTPEPLPHSITRVDSTGSLRQLGACARQIFFFMGPAHNTQGLSGQHCLPTALHGCRAHPSGCFSQCYRRLDNARSPTCLIAACAEICMHPLRRPLFQGPQGPEPECARRGDAQSRRRNRGCS